MTDRNLNIRVSLSAANKLSSPVSAAQRSAAGFSAQIKATQNSIRNLAGQATTFERMSQSVAQTSAAYEDTKKKVKALREAYPSLKQRTDEQNRTLAQARQERDRYGRTLDKEKQKLQASAAQLYRHGVSIRQSENATAQITKRTALYNQQLDAQKQKLAAITRAQANYAKTKEVRNKLAVKGAAGIAAGSGFLYGASKITSYGRDFDEGMSGVQALTRLDKNDLRLQMLKDQARKLGATTAYAATDAAAGQRFLAMAGFTPEAIKAAMPGVLNMGLAGDIDLGEASDIGSNVLTQFKMNADQMDRISDVLTATFTRSNTDLRQLGETMTYAGPVAAQLGVSIESMAAMAGSLADNGIRGSMAGTALRAGLSRLVAPAGKGQAAMTALGVSVKTASGELRSADDILKDVGKNLSRFDQASQIRLKKELFGEEAMVGMGAAIDAAMSGRYDELLSANLKAKGEAAKNAKIKTDNLNGDFKELQSAWEELGIIFDETIRPLLRSLTQGITSAIEAMGRWLKEHPALTKVLTIGAGAIASVAVVLGGLAVAAASVIVPLAALRLGLFMVAGSSSLLTVLGGVLSALISPIGLVAAALVGAGIAIYRYWSQISAFFRGFFEGLIVGLSPVREAFSTVFSIITPLFNGITSAVKHLWQWISNLFSPIKASDEALKNCTAAGKTFGQVVGFAISALMTPITAVANGLGWILEKLGVIPSAASAAAEMVNSLSPTPPSQEAVAHFTKQGKWLTEKLAPNLTKRVKEKAGQLWQNVRQKNQDEAIETAAAASQAYGTAVYQSGVQASKTSNRLGLSSTLKNKLGEIVFKNYPAIQAIDGLYQDPVVSKTGGLTRSDVIPSKMDIRRPAQSTPAPNGRKIELHLHGIDMKDSQMIEAAVTRAIAKIQRELGVKRRSQLFDGGI